MKRERASVGSKNHPPSTLLAEHKMEEGRFLLPLSSRQQPPSTRQWLLLACRSKLLYLILGVPVIYTLIRQYYALELAITDPVLEAQLFMPLRYFAVRFLAERPRGTRVFSMTPDNAYVINLDKDEARRATFYSKNNLEEKDLPRFAGYHWLSDSTPAEQFDYPWLQTSVRKGLYGDAGCTLSHIRVLQDCIDKNRLYCFIFEDDSRLLPPLTTTRQVEAPDNADAVHLVGTSTKIVPVPYKEPQVAETPAFRVIQGYGALGYVITQAGAKKLLAYLRKHSQPIDIALTVATTLVVYRPTNGFPQVSHVPPTGSSTRRQVNNVNNR